MSETPRQENPDELREGSFQPVREPEATPNGRVPSAWSDWEQRLADAWYAGRVSVQILSFHEATGPTLKARCAADLHRIIQLRGVGEGAPIVASVPAREVSYLAWEFVRNPNAAADVHAALNRMLDRYVMDGAVRHAGVLAVCLVDRVLPRFGSLQVLGVDENERLKVLLGSTVLAPCKHCGTEWPYPSVLSSSHVCDGCRRKAEAVAESRLTGLQALVEQWRAKAHELEADRDRDSFDNGWSGALDSCADDLSALLSGDETPSVRTPGETNS